MRILVLLMCAFTAPAIAGSFRAHAAGTARNIEGTWQGTLTVGPQMSITIQFTFGRKPDGTYSALLTSPGSSSVRNIAASSVSCSDGTVIVHVAAFSLSFSGTLTEHGIEGTWTQAGVAAPLVLNPLLSDKERQSTALAGTWTATVESGHGKWQNTYCFVVDGTLLTGTVSTPEGTYRIERGRIDGDLVSFEQRIFGDEGDFPIFHVGRTDSNDTLQLARTTPEHQLRRVILKRVGSGCETLAPRPAPPIRAVTS